MSKIEINKEQHIPFILPLFVILPDIGKSLLILNQLCTMALTWVTKQVVSSHLL